MSTTEGPEQYLGYNLKRAQHRLHRRMEDALRDCGLTSAQFAVLASLSACPDQTNADLANAAFITPQSMQSVLSKLEDAGHVVRQQDERHGRRQLARLTPSGEALTQQGNRAAEQVEKELIGALHPLSLNDALDMLHRLQRAMK